MRRWIFWLLVVAGILIGLLRFAIKLEAQNNSGLTNQSDELEKLILANKATAEKKQYDEWLSNQLVRRAYLVRGERIGSCVVGVRRFLGITGGEIRGVAKDIPTNATEPTIGGIVKTNESEYGHIAVIIAITDQSLILVESNYRFDGKYDIRELPRTSDKIIGYIERR